MPPQERENSGSDLLHLTSIISWPFFKVGIATTINIVLFHIIKVSNTWKLRHTRIHRNYIAQDFNMIFLGEKLSIPGDICVFFSYYVMWLWVVGTDKTTFGIVFIWFEKRYPDHFRFEIRPWMLNFRRGNVCCRHQDTQNKKSLYLPTVSVKIDVP